jgi:ABC-type antimicrobial peptide transport system permease subunit
MYEALTELTVNTFVQAAILGKSVGLIDCWKSHELYDNVQQMIILVLYNDAHFGQADFQTMKTSQEKNTSASRP